MLLAGCVAETVRKNAPRKGPVKAVGYVDMGGGEVRYSTDGWGWFVAGRRRAARALMSHICGKLKPVLTDEFDKEDVDVPYSQDDIAATLQRGAEHFTLAPFTHLVFECAYSSTAPVTAQPPQGLPPPPRPEAPLVEVYAAGYSSAPAPTAIAVGTAAPATSGVVTFSSAPATPALTTPAPAGGENARPPGTARQGAPPPAAAWIAFPSAWAPVSAPPKIKISSAAPVAVSKSSAAPSAVPSGVKQP
jgi:hypothetical protein